MTHQGKLTGLLGTMAWGLSSPLHRYFGRYIDATGSFDLGLVWGPRSSLAGGERIGPVAAFKTATVVKRLPKTRSGKNSRHHAEDGRLPGVQNPGHHRRPDHPPGDRGCAQEMGKKPKPWFGIARVNDHDPWR